MNTRLPAYIRHIRELQKRIREKEIAINVMSTCRGGVSANSHNAVYSEMLEEMRELKELLDMSPNEWMWQQDKAEYMKEEEEPIEVT